jgi:AcrR family transcriptional regulator
MPGGKRSASTHSVHSKLGSRSGAAKLTPGSRLPAEVVRANQRERLMTALVDVVDRRGLCATTVSNVTERAHVSRAAFYENFESIEDAFLTTYDSHTARASEQIVAAYDNPDLAWPKRIEAAMDALVGAAETWPAAARMCLSEILTAGSAAGERNERAIALVRNLLAHGRADAGDRAPVSLASAVAVSGGLRRVLYNGLRKHQDEPPADLAHELSSWLVACSPHALTLLEPHADQPAGKASGRAGASVTPATDGQLSGVEAAIANAVASVQLAAPGDEQDALNERRERIVEAVLELAATNGYAGMTHRDIASYARVSFSTFYSHFENKQEALLAACELAHERLASRVMPAIAAAPDWAHGVSDGIAAYLRAAAENPREARVVGLEIFSVGRAGLDHADRYAAEFERLLDPGFERNPQISRTAAPAFAGAMLELLRHYAAARRIAELPAAGPELAYIALAPFVGARDAQRIARYRPRYRTAAEPPALEAAGRARRRSSRS